MTDLPTRHETRTDGRPGGERPWPRLRAEAAELARAEPLLGPSLHAAILAHDDLAGALAFVLAARLSDDRLAADDLRPIFASAFNADGRLIEAAEADIIAVYERDAACRSFLQPVLHFKGYLALQAYRAGHWLWGEGREGLAFELQSRVSERLGVDIHPAAVIGRGVMIDHATSVVIGETTVVGDGCSLLHEVTLGGTGVKGGDRHPKIGSRVLIGAGAKVLGNITVGDDAKIAAGSVVLKSVPARCTVAGVPAEPVAGPCKPDPAKRMDQSIEEAG